MDLHMLMGILPLSWGEEVQTTSHLFAKWLGIYLVIMSLYSLVRGKGVEVVKEEVRRSPALLSLMGGTSVFFGAFFVASHSLFVWSWPVLITIFGYFLLIKGILVLFFTRFFHDLHTKLGSYFCRAWSILWLIVGLILLWFGYFSR